MYSQSITPQQVIAALESHGCNPHRSGNGWKSKCPSHDGKSQSLSIDAGDTGKAVIHCFGGCAYPTVMAALGLNQTNSAKRRIVATYDYDGHYETVRYEPKGFAQRRKLESGEYAWNTKNTATRIYRQDDLMAAKSAEIVVVEGEKDVETLRGVGVLAVTNHGGAGKWKAAHTAALVAAGVKTVVVLPDNDEPGIKHGHAVASSCTAAGLAVQWLELPAKDVTDYLGLNSTPALSALIASAADWTPPAVKAEALPTETSEAAPPISEHVVALDFTDRHRATLRYCHETERWYEWDKVRWRPDRLARAFHYARTLSGESSDTKTARKAAFARGVESFCRADPAHAVEASYWDVDPWLLGTPTGTIDLKSGRVRAPDPSHRITKLTAIGPGKSDECPRWLQFLDESTGGDGQLVAFLKKWFGYCLTGSVQEHALIFLHGAGSNGKSVFLNVLSGILGDYSTTASMDILIAAQHDRHPTEIASLSSARLVTASETEESRLWAEARIKALTGGEPLSARFMRKDLFEFMPQFKLALSGNQLPALHNCGAAMRRRFNLVPFDKTPAAPDPELGDKLKSEWPSILAWAIEGCALWRQEGLGTAAVIEEETDNYFTESDHFSSWFESDCELDPEAYELATDLFTSWSKYLKRIKEPEENNTKFGRRLRATRGLRKEKSGTVRWHGVRLTGLDSYPHLNCPST